MQLSVVIPAFNESRRIAATLDTLAAVLAGSTAELIVIDDGSRDGTHAAAEAWIATRSDRTPPSRLLRLERNRGKGAALQAGLDAATGERVLLCDADLSTPPAMLARLQAALDAGADIAIGSRDLPDSRRRPPQPWGRRLAAATFRWIRRRMLLPRLRDTQCGFKLLRRERVAAIAAACRETRWLFDLELLALADAAALRIAEVAVDWADVRPSRVRWLREWPATLLGLWRISARVRRFDKLDRGGDNPER